MSDSSPPRPGGSSAPRSGAASPRPPDDLLRRLRRARVHADRHVAEPLDLEQLAAVAAISRWHVHPAVHRHLRSHAGRLQRLGRRATHAELRAQGVELLQEPAERPCGIEALMRDDSGNWLVSVEPREYTPEDVAGLAD